MKCTQSVTTRPRWASSWTQGTAILACLCFSASMASACTEIPPRLGYVGTDFSVLVIHDGKPVQGIEVRLQGDSRITKQSDATGVVTFSGMASGDYFLSV